ncbi:glycosyltransferase family 2 protein [Andreprevotia chitinilytica]|uniref:glycosyltransferase family 2 protein n=1 Tax=Andreprevotia chitinilytica TaxID=396808 RepID=UPI00068AFDB2|nr:glycosyltransferase family 2 protein [Andreprevotia chitinilytica]
MTAPRISILLPCYNSALHLQETLDSLSAQSFTDFECIAINDGSSDTTLARLNAHAAQDPRFKIISRENRGLIATLNEGIAAAQGEWIARMDADDIAHPQRLEKQLAVLQASGADVCGVGVRFIGGRDGLWLPPTTDAALKAALLFNPPFAHPGVMARTTLLKQHGYDPTAQHAEDYALWCTLARAGAIFTAVAEPLLDYRIHPGQITQTRRDDLAATARRVRTDYAQAFLPADWSEAEKRFFALHASPETTLDFEQWFDFTEALLKLATRDPATKPAFATVWLDALVRTQSVNSRYWTQFSRLCSALPVPVEEQGKLTRQRSRVVMGDFFYGLLKLLRGRR